jgi:hypothetical protein
MTGRPDRERRPIRFGFWMLLLIPPALFVALFLFGFIRAILSP